MATGFYFLVYFMTKQETGCPVETWQLLQNETVGGLVKIFTFELKMENLVLVPSRSHSKQTNLKKQN